MTKIFTLDQIKTVIDKKIVIKSIEEGFALLSEGNVVLAPVSHLDLTDPKGMIHIKYGYIKGDNVYVIKTGSYMPENASLHLPTINASLSIYDKQTGQLKAILLDEGYLTNIRTAAAGAVVAKYLAPKDVKKIGILGTGLQARLQLEYLQSVVACRKVVVWGRRREALDAYKKEMEEKGWEITTTTNIEDITANCNYIVTTTSSDKPLLTENQIMPGTHITAMGADAKGKEELDPQILQKADMVVSDSRQQCMDHGEISYAIEKKYIAKSQIIEIGELILRDKRRDNDSQITVADLTGVAIQDIQIAKQVYSLLEERN